MGKFYSKKDPVRIRILTPTRILYFRENSATKQEFHTLLNKVLTSQNQY